MRTPDDKTERLHQVATGMRHRADHLAGTGTSLAATELRHYANLIDHILNDDDPDTPALVP